MTWAKAGLAATVVGGAILAGGAGLVVAASASAPAAAQKSSEPAPAPKLAPIPGGLAGVVVDETGTPIQGALVDVWTWYPGNETRTDAQGKFVIRGVGDQPVEIRVSKDGLGPRYNPDQPTGAPDLRIVLSNKTYFEGTVKGPDGKPVADALIRADCGPKRNPGVQITNVWTETRSDANGHYRLYVAPDTYDMQVRVPRVGAARFQQTRIAQGEAKAFDINLTPGITFRAVVVDSETGKPVPNVHLKNWQQKDIEEVSDKDGMVSIEGMQPGLFEFTQVEANGYARWWSQQAAREWEKKDTSHDLARNFDGISFNLNEGMEAVKIELERAVRLSGTVKDPDGKPVAGATVAPAHTGTGNSITGDTRYSVTTAGDGTFTMVLPASGKANYNLVAHDGQFRQWRRWANGVMAPMQTKPDEEIGGIEIQLTRPAAVRGHIKDAAGNPVTGREVRASAADKLENRYYDPTTTTDKNGNFELRFIRPGTHYIQVAPFWLDATQAPAGTSATVTLKENETKEGVELVLNELKARVSTPVPMPAPKPTDAKEMTFAADADVQALLPAIRESEDRYNDIEYTYRCENNNNEIGDPNVPAVGPVRTRITEISAIYQGACSWLSLVENSTMPDGKTNSNTYAVAFDGKAVHAVAGGKALPGGDPPGPNPMHPFRLVNFNGRLPLSQTIEGGMADIFRKAGFKGVMRISRLADEPYMDLPCVRLQWEEDTTLSDRRSHSRWILWLCPERNYLPLRAERYQPNDLGHEELTLVKEVKELAELAPGVYFPVWIESERRGLAKTGRGIKEQITFSNVHLKPSYPLERFKDASPTPQARQ